MGPYYNLELPDFWPGELEDPEGYHNTYIVARHEWKAKKPRFRQPVKGLHSTFHFRYTDTDQCRKAKECKRIVLDLQIRHMLQGYPDIQYNYLIGGDDNYYEGVGWRNHVKDIHLPPGEKEEETPSLILAYIGREEEISRDRLWKKHMEKQGHHLLAWAIENRLVQNTRFFH